MGLNIENIDGQTPLDEEEKEGLLIPTITTRGELDEFEQQNIEQAIQWYLSQSFKPEVVFTDRFIRTIHKRMFAEVWSWAGHFRKTNKNIGIDRLQISIEFKKLLDDVKYWHESTIYPYDEIAVRFKHRLVSIHCFSNGNGRHSRLMADIIIEKLYKKTNFSWGSATYSDEQKKRTLYLKALKVADKGDYDLLIAFARS